MRDNYLRDHYEPVPAWGAALYWARLVVGLMLLGGAAAVLMGCGKIVYVPAPGTTPTPSLTRPPATVPSPAHVTPSPASTPIHCPPGTIDTCAKLGGNGPCECSPYVYVPHPPKQDMTTSGSLLTNAVDAKGRKLTFAQGDITQHIKKPVEIPADVLGEIPPELLTPQACPGAGAANCDGYDPNAPFGGGHYSSPDGSHKTCLWWGCGGSEMFDKNPRDWDMDTSKMFEVSVSAGLSLLYGRPQFDAQGNVVKDPEGKPVLKPGCYRDDWHNYCIGKADPGAGTVTGTVTICLPWGAKTSDGVPLPVLNRCGSRPVRID